MKSLVALAVVALGLALFVSASTASAPPLIVFAATRAPTVTGEIFRLDPNGHRVDLSKSPFYDAYPAVSSDGKTVAFVSDRSGRDAVWTVGIDGRGVTAAGLSIPSLDSRACDPQLGWQPGGTRLGVMACSSDASTVWIVRRGQRPLRVAKQEGDDSVTPLSFAWSRHGLLAISTASGEIEVYGGNGQLIWSKDLGAYKEPYWSPNGKLIAIYDGSAITVVRATDGHKVAGAKSPNGPPGAVYAWTWIDNRHFVSAVNGTATVLDVRTGTVGKRSGNWFGPFSADGKLSAVVGSDPRYPKPFSVGVAPTRGGTTKTYGAVRGCNGSDGAWLPDESSLQFAGPTRSLVYESNNYCVAVFSNLYAVAGGRIHRLTNAIGDQVEPTLSPDGTEIAYVWSTEGTSPDGCRISCSDGIRITTAAGEPIRTLTNPSDYVFTDSPAWSPDGSTIIYSKSMCGPSACPNRDELFTRPATGGKQHKLGIEGYEPAWGPTRIAYAEDGIWTVKPDGSDPIRVSKHGSYPAYSASGALAFLVGTKVVWDGTAHQLPFASIASLAWSADGKRFFVSAHRKTDPADQDDLYSVRTDGTHPVRLTKNFGVD